MWHCCLCLLSPSLALLAASSVQAEGWKNPGGWVQLGGRNDGDPHFAVDCAPGWGGGGWGWLCSLLQELGALGWAACIPQDLFTNSRKLAQGSRAPADPEAYNVNYHHVIKSP